MLLPQKENTSINSTAKAQADELFQRQAYFVQQVTNATPDMIFVLNIQENRLSFVNLPTARLLGVSVEHLYQSGPEIFKERIHPKELEARTHFHQNLATLQEDEVRAIEIRLKVADGSYRWYKLRDKTFERDAKGQVLQTICIVQDINERVHAEQENARLERQQQKAEATTYKKMISQVLSTFEEDYIRVAHFMQEELGQLLFAAKLRCDLTSHDPDFQFNDSLRQYNREIEQLLTICIKESRRIAHELQPLQVEHFGIADALKELCKAYHSESLDLNCSVTGFQAPVEKYLQITLYRMVQELVINIVRHAGATRARVNVSRSKKSIKLSVQDNGHSLDKPEAEQQGLGLKLIKNKVNLLKGTFKLTADAGKGTKVSIAIPI